MKKIFFTLLSLLTVSTGMCQCNTFFPLQPNVRYEYEHFDKKDKLALRMVQMFKDISGSGNNVQATMVQEIIDVKKGDIINTSESEWTCKNGTLHFTVNTLTLPIDNAKQADMGAGGMSVEVTGDKMDLPSTLTVGQTLNDVNYQMKMSMSGITLMNRTFKVQDRKVEALENVTTPAGTFDCYKISFSTVSEGGIGAGTVKSSVWYAKDVGLVKSEHFNEDSKPMGRQILTKIAK